MVAFNLGTQHNQSNTAVDTYVDRQLAALEFKIKAGSVCVTGEGFWGQALGADFVRTNMDINPTPADGGDPKEIEAISGFLSATATINDKQNISFGYGVDDPKDEDMEGINALTNFQYTKNSILFANTWYKITQAIQVGAETMYVNTQRFDQT
ncbi:MAG: hypothetical protein V1753_07970, partial [Pseudomonadota bacterium]